MWYFAWILGLGLAVLLAVLNAMLYDAEQCAEGERGSAGDMASPGPELRP